MSSSASGSASAYLGAEYEDLLEDVKRELMDSVQIARSAGIPDEHIILDPGIGFGKTVEQNLELINRLDEIRALGFPGPAGALPQILHRLHPRPASRPAPGRDGRRRGDRHRPRGGYRARP